MALALRAGGGGPWAEGVGMSGCSSLSPGHSKAPQFSRAVYKDSSGEARAILTLPRT